MRPTSITHALTLIQAAGYPAAKIVRAEDIEESDDEIQIGENIGVQVGASSDGLFFYANFSRGEGNDYTSWMGSEQEDPVAAAHEAKNLATKHGG